MRKIRLCTIFLFGVCAAAQANNACPAGRSPILILGSYHMSNPGLDSVNLQADDVLSAQRQQEIAEVVERLAKFAPTKVAVEAPYRDAAVTGNYAKFLQGSYTLRRNEVDQIGFRLAQRMNLPSVEPVDYPMFMSGLTPGEIEDPKPAAEPKPSAPPKPAPPLSEEDQLLRRSTVREYLLHVNESERVRKDQAGYINMLLPDKKSAAIYARADLVTNWYKRNLRILTNLNRVVNVGTDRVVLVIGFGHLAILRQFVQDSNYYCLVTADEYLK